MKTKKWMLAAAAMFASAAMVSAHLPSIYDARFQIDRERERKSQELQSATRGALRAQSAATWDKDKEYDGSYKTYQGDTVIWGDWKGKPLHWWAKFWTKNDEPGTPGAGGGTSPWVLINSESYGKGYQWQGYGPGGSINNGQARVATWRNGAHGAYSFTHDDIGSMPLDKSVAPAYELALESGFEEIKQSWGVFVKMMDENEWNYAIKMVGAGHEMFNHSWDHTSAADQYQWFYNKGEIPDFDPSIPYAIRGLKVKALWGNPTWGAPWNKPEWGVPVNPNVRESGKTLGNCAPTSPGDPIRILTLEDNNIKIEGPAYWTGYSFSTDACVNKLVDMTITPKGNTKKVKLPTGMEVFVNYTKEVDIAGLAEDGSSPDIKNEGTLYATTPAWLDPDQLKKYGENGWEAGDVMYPELTGNGMNPSTKCPADKTKGDDCGVPGLIASIWTTAKWAGDDWRRNIKDANDAVNSQIYEKITNPGKHFAVGKRSEYYGYPMDAYSTESNLELAKYGVPMARAGSKTPQVMKGDFFHPYAIDFDAFYIEKSNWTPASQGEGFVYPDNAHIWLGLNEMVDKIIQDKGYMIREFHAVAAIEDNAWYDNGSPSFWPLNSSAKMMGGWWGGITKNQLRVHYNYVKDRIKDGRLVVYTASEAVKYRLTANATSAPVLSKNGNDYNLSVSFAGVTDVPADEISVIVGIDATNKLNVEYPNGGNPRLAPKPLNDNGTAWSINFNPEKSTSVKLIPGQDFVEPEWVGPDTSLGDKGGSGGGAGNFPCHIMPNAPGCPGVGISKTADKVTSFAFTGIQNGQINLRLTAGNYTAQLYNMQGRVVGNVNFNAVNGVNATGLKTDNLAKGIFVLNVKDAKGASVLQHKLMLK